MLEGRHVVVTGAGRGIGAACARGVARLGGAVTCWDVDGDTAAAVAGVIEGAGGRARSAAVDVRERARVEQALVVATDALGPVDALVANAGGAAGERTPFLELDDEQWSAMLDRNLGGAFVCGSVFGRHLAARRTGSIVFVTSVTAEIVQPGLAHYAAAKGGVRQLMRTMALELADYGVAVNAVAPGVTLTPGNQEGMSRPGVMERFTEQIPWGRVAHPDDIAGTVAFLIGPESRYTTGTSVVVDGGLTLQ